MIKIAAVINLLAGAVMVAIPFVLGSKNIGMWVGLEVGGAVCLLVGLFLLIGGARSGAANKILATGVPATAVIRGVRETGITMQHGMYIIMDFNLEVGPGTPSPYQVTCRSTVPRVGLSMIGIGKLVAVKVDPANRNRVVIDWNAVPA